MNTERVKHTPDCRPGNRCDECKTALAQRQGWLPEGGRAA